MLLATRATCASSVPTSPAMSSRSITWIGTGGCSAFDVVHILERGREPVEDCGRSVDGRIVDEDQLLDADGGAGIEELSIERRGLHDAFVAIDSDGDVIEWNRQAEATFGYLRDVDGLLVGGASLDPAEFANIVRFESHLVTD